VNGNGSDHGSKFEDKEIVVCGTNSSGVCLGQLLHGHHFPKGAPHECDGYFGRNSTPSNSELTAPNKGVVHDAAVAAQHTPQTVTEKGLK